MGDVKLDSYLNASLAVVPTFHELFSRHLRVGRKKKNNTMAMHVRQAYQQSVKSD